MIYQFLFLIQTIFVFLAYSFDFNLTISLIVHTSIFAVTTFLIRKENKKREIELEKNNKSMENQAKLAALGEIAAGIAHEINNPVAIVHGKAQLIELQIEEAKETNSPISIEELHENTQDILQTVARIDKIINSLRYFVRDDSRNPLTMANVEEILDNVQVLSIDRCKKNGVLVQIEKNIKKDTSFLCKPTQISQVLINLINNSFDALQSVEQKEKWIKIICSEDKENILFKIIDNGPGIPKEMQDKILNSFYTSKTSTKNNGLGIGLTIAKRIVDQHLGLIYLDKEAKYTTFNISLPKGEK